MRQGQTTQFRFEFASEVSGLIAGDGEVGMPPHRRAQMLGRSVVPKPLGIQRLGSRASQGAGEAS
jgi:hypothetical protein